MTVPPGYDEPDAVAVAMLADPVVGTLPVPDAVRELAQRLRRALGAPVVAVFGWGGDRRFDLVALERGPADGTAGDGTAGEGTAGDGTARDGTGGDGPWTVAALAGVAEAATRPDRAAVAGNGVSVVPVTTPGTPPATSVVLQVAGSPAGVIVVGGLPAGDVLRHRSLVQLAAERAAAVLALRQLETAERRHRLGIEHASRHLALLVRAGDALAGAVTDLRPALEAVGAVVVPMFADWFAVDLLPDGETTTPGSGACGTRRVVVDTAPAADRAAGAPGAHRHPDGDRLVAAVLAGGQAEMVVRRPPAGGDHLPGPEHGHGEPAGAAESVLVVPVRMRGTVVGAASFVTGAGRRGYRMSDLRVAEDLADRIGVTVERVRLWHAHQRAASAAEANERRLHAVVDASPLAIVELDRSVTPVWWNPAARRLLGWPDPGQGPAGTDGPDPAAGAGHGGRVPGAGELGTVWARACRGEHVVGEVVQAGRPDGSTAHLSVSCAPMRDADGELTGALAMVEDVTERLRLVDRFHQAERLEAMARLAGSVAHDFNNLLTVVLGSCAQLLEHMDPDDPLVEEARAIRTAGQRAADLTSQLLSIGHRRPLQPVEVDPDAVLAAMQGVLARVVGDDVVVEHVSLGPRAHVLVEPAELERAVLNLALNARDAMPDGGRLTLGTRTRRLDGADSPVVVDVWVADTGTGMDARTVEHCFEPFFTTKARGSGTGLGLSSVHSSVTAAGGVVAVDSRPGAGTTFTLSFPAVEGLPPDRADGEPEEDEPVVLVVDDDSDVRRLVVQALVRQGFLVVAAADADEALESVASATDQVALLITDVSMPGMGGRELAARLVAASPQLPVLYMTGDEVAGVLAPGADVLRKPFSPAELVARARAAIERGARA